MRVTKIIIILTCLILIGGTVFNWVFRNNKEVHQLKDDSPYYDEFQYYQEAGDIMSQLDKHGESDKVNKHFLEHELSRQLDMNYAENEDEYEYSYGIWDLMKNIDVLKELYYIETETKKIEETPAEALVVEETAKTANENTKVTEEEISLEESIETENQETTIITTTLKIIPNESNVLPTEEVSCETPHFVENDSGRVMLATYPGSGNTWTRHLIEKATGVLTGAVYNDGKLKKIFRGEHVYDGTVSAIKTHYPRFNRYVDVVKGADGSIIIIRCPFDTILANYNREKNHGSHTNLVPRQYFDDHPKEWQNHIDKELDRTSKFYHYWNETSTIPTLFIQFNDLKDDLINAMEKMVSFIHSIKPRVSYAPYWKYCLTQETEGSFHRSHDGIKFNPFTSDQRQSICEYLQAKQMWNTKRWGECMKYETYQSWVTPQNEPITEEQEKKYYSEHSEK